MIIDNPVVFALNIATISVILFSANLLILRSFERQTYLPLAICLLAIGIVIVQPSLQLLSPNLKVSMLILSLPALLLIGPCLWFYVQGLTSATPWCFQRRSFPHLLPFGIGSVIALLALALPSEIKHAILVEGNEEILQTTTAIIRNLTYVVLTVTFVLVLGWVVQSAYYFYKILRQLSAYRQRLKDVFASTESREIKWLSWLLIAIGTVWVAAAINLVIDNLFFPSQLNASWSAIMVLLMVASVATWGLRQKPGFEELYSEQITNETLIEGNNDSAPKYQRSALTEQNSSNIAEKIEFAMQQDTLYLDASLSLPKLAKHIHTSPNYISQTLNETLGMSFFDYVNKYRVNAAQQLLENTEETVLNIAMAVGFNSKSSFYTAFKKHTQLTPSQFKNQAKDIQSS